MVSISKEILSIEKEFSKKIQVFENKHKVTVSIHYSPSKIWNCLGGNKMILRFNSR
jgi:uncharacterized membrane protein